jgi:hypothetical protein
MRDDGREGGPAWSSYRRRAAFGDAVVRAGAGVTGGTLLVVGAFFHDQGAAFIGALGVCSVVLGLRSSTRRVYRWEVRTDGRVELAALRRRYDLPARAIILVYDDDWDDPAFVVLPTEHSPKLLMSLATGQALQAALSTRGGSSPDRTWR